MDMQRLFIIRKESHLAAEKLGVMSLTVQKDIGFYLSINMMD